MKKAAEIRLLRRVEALENAVRHLLDKEYPLDCIGHDVDVSQKKFGEHVITYMKPYKMEKP